VKKALAAWAFCGLMVAVAHAGQSPSEEAIQRNNRGVELLKQGQVVEAVGHFRTALQMAPGYTEAQGNLAYAYEQSGRLDEAVAAYQKLLELEPKNAVALNNLATLYSRSGRHDDAIRELEALVQADPGSETARRNLETAKRNKGILQERGERSARALKAADARPNDPRAAYDVARVYAEQGDDDKALAWLGKAFTLGYGQLDFVKVDPAFTTLRKDARFGKLLEEQTANPRASR
jgi:superkiller protein 3